MRNAVNLLTCVLVAGLCVVASADDMQAILNSSDGSTSFDVADSATNILFSVDSSGNTGIYLGDFNLNGRTIYNGFFDGDGSQLTNLNYTVDGLDNVIYVGMNGTPSGPGTIEKPYSSPQVGYDVAATNFGGQVATLVIAAGTYPGLTMHTGNVHVVGLHKPDILDLTVTGTGSVLGKPRVEDLIVLGMLSVNPGTKIKFRNVRVEGGTAIYGDMVEFQDCYLTGPSPSVEVLTGSMYVGFYQTCIEVGAAGTALLVNDGVNHLEVMGCELVTSGGGLAIDDQQISSLDPLHLYTHNYIKGMADSTVVQAWNSGGTAIGFHENTVHGNLGNLAVGGVNARTNYFSNNAIYGAIRWVQAATVTTDPYNNSLISTIKTLPDAWDD